MDTVLATPRVQPGGLLHSEVRIKGGDFDADIECISLGLVTRVEFEHGEGEQIGLVEFHRVQASGPFQLRAGEDKTVPFQFPVPWEAPVTEIAGRHLNGMAMGVRTELAIAEFDPFALLFEGGRRPSRSDRDSRLLRPEQAAS